MDNDELERDLVKRLTDVWKNIHDSITTLRKHKKFIQSELILVLVGADAFSRILAIMDGSALDDVDRESEARFKKWLNRCVFVKENKWFRKHWEEINCDAGLLWKVRHALIHFYGLPNADDTGGQVAFSGGDLKTIRYRRSEIKTRGFKIRLVHSQYLIQAILYGLIVQVYLMQQMKSNDPDTYHKRAAIAYDLLMKEGAVAIGADNY